MTKRSLTIAGHRTSVSLEDSFWQGLRDMAADRGCTLAALVTQIDTVRGEASLSSAIRERVLVYCRERAKRGHLPDSVADTGHPVCRGSGWKAVE